jgi:hypothetical protein
VGDGVIALWFTVLGLPLIRALTPIKARAYLKFAILLAAIGLAAIPNYFAYLTYSRYGFWPEWGHPESWSHYPFENRPDLLEFAGLGAVYALVLSFFGILWTFCSIIRATFQNLKGFGFLMKADISKKRILTECIYLIVFGALIVTVGNLFMWIGD